MKCTLLKTTVTILFVAVTFVGNVSSGKILILHPIYSGSHEFVLRHWGDHLVARGHEVTQVSDIFATFFALL